MPKSKDAPRLAPRQVRLLVGGSAGLTLAVVAYWWLFSAGIPVLWGPTASAAEREAGRDLFEHEWAANDPLAHGDGVGPVFNATSCAACHFQGGVGGGGDAAHNATHFEVLAVPGRNDYLSGVLHANSVSADTRETAKGLHALFPVVVDTPPPPAPAPPPPPQSGGHCDYVPTPYVRPKKPDFDAVNTHAVQATALFGAGWIDRLPAKAITNNAHARGTGIAVAELKLDFDHIPVGRVRTLPDGRVGKFGWKAQFATLDEFVANACANELGLGTPTTPQARPISQSSAADVPPDLDQKQFRELVAFVDTLPRPVEAEGGAAVRGKEVFRTVGCAACHVPDLGGVKGVYSDFLLYTLEDPTPKGTFGYGNEPLPEAPRPKHLPAPQEWKTPPLWGVADSAPYMHDGSAPDLKGAITAHRGDAKTVSAAYQKLPADDQAAVLAFLGSLKAPPDAVPSKVKAPAKK